MKRASFVAVGILLLGSAFAVAKTTGKTTSKGQVTNGQRFDDWSIACEQVNEQSTKICHARQSLSVKDQDTVLAEYRVGYFGGDELKMVQILPANINIPSGTSIILDKEITSPGQYTSCQAQYCIATAVIDEAFVTRMSKASDVYVAFIDSQGKQINSILSAKGLEHAVKALKRAK